MLQIALRLLATLITILSLSITLGMWAGPLLSPAPTALTMPLAEDTAIFFDQRTAAHFTGLVRPAQVSPDGRFRAIDADLTRSDCCQTLIVTDGITRIQQEITLDNLAHLYTFFWVGDQLALMVDDLAQREFSMRLLDPITGTVTTRFVLDSRAFNKAIPSPTRQHIALTIGRNEQLGLYDLAQDTLTIIKPDAFRDVRWSPDGAQLAYIHPATPDAIIRYDIQQQTNEVIYTGCVTSLWWGIDPQSVLLEQCSEQVVTVLRLDVKTGRVLHARDIRTGGIPPGRYDLREEIISQVGWSPDGLHVAYFDANTNKIAVASMIDHSAPLNINGTLIAWSDDSRYLLTSDGDEGRQKRVIVTDIYTGDTQVHRLPRGEVFGTRLLRHDAVVLLPLAAE